jgi:hypothetical protein
MQFGEASTMKRSPNLWLARQIRDAGRPIAIAEDDDPDVDRGSPGVLIHQTGGSLETCAFDHTGGTGYLVSLSITIVQSRIAISSFDLKTPWEKIGFWWIPDPLISGKSRFYKLAYLELDREQVLNHRANQKPLRRGATMEGFLVGTEFGSVPAEFRRREIEVALIIFDQFDQQHRASFSMFVEPATNQPKPRKTRAPLLDRPDPREVPKKVSTFSEKPIPSIEEVINDRPRD